MKTKIIYLMLICIFPILSFSQSNYYLELVKTEPIIKTKAPINTKGLFPVRDYNDSIVAWKTGYWVGKSDQQVADSAYVFFPDGKKIEIEPLGGVRISTEAKLIITRGQKVKNPRKSLSNPKRRIGNFKHDGSFLIFYDLNGKLIKRYDNKYFGNPFWVMSKNGYTVFSGRKRSSDDKNFYITSFDPKGNEITEKNIGKKGIKKIQISNNGNYIAYSREIEYNKFEITILNKKLKTVFSYTASKVPGYLYFSGDENFLSILGSHDYSSFIDIINKKKLIETNKKFSISSNPVYYFRNDKILAVTSFKEGKYYLNLLNTETEKLLFSQQIPEKGNFKYYNEEQFKIEAKNNICIYQLKKK